jgi:cytoskeletal protein RodZ
MATVHLVKTPEQWVHPAGQQDDRRIGFGEWLRRAREARGLTLADITRETKIPLRNLEALEHGHLGFVPEFYERAEVRAIARAVGVDEGLAMGRLDSAISPVVAQPKPRIAPQTNRLALPAILGALAMGFLIWTIAQPQRQLDQSAEPTAAATQASLQDTQATLQEPAAPAWQPPGVDAADVSPAVAPAVAVPATTAVAVPAPAVAPPVATAAAAPAETAAETTDIKVPTGSFTEIVVTTEPSGAHVTVNGIGWGVSPVTIRHLPPGSKHIRATKEGFAATERVLTLGSGQRQALGLRLGAPD